MANKKVSDEELDLIVQVMSHPESLQNKETFNKFYEASTKSIRVADLAYIVPAVIDRRLLSVMQEQAIVEDILHKKFKVTKEDFKKYTKEYQERLNKEMEKAKNTSSGDSMDKKENTDLKSESKGLSETKIKDKGKQE